MESPAPVDASAEGQPPRAGSQPAAPPRFETRAMRASDCELASAAAAAEGVLLSFGTREVRDAAAGSVGAAQAHCVRLDATAAKHLEEALTRVLGAEAPAAGKPGPAAR